MVKTITQHIKYDHSENDSDTGESGDPPGRGNVGLALIDHLPPGNDVGITETQEGQRGLRQNSACHAAGGVGHHGENTIWQDVFEENLRFCFPQSYGGANERALSEGEGLCPQVLSVTRPGRETDDDHHIGNAVAEEGYDEQNQEEGGYHQEDVDDLGNYLIHPTAQKATKATDEYAQSAGDES